MAGRTDVAKLLESPEGAEEFKKRSLEKSAPAPTNQNDQPAEKKMKVSFVIKSRYNVRKLDIFKVIRVPVSSSILGILKIVKFALKGCTYVTSFEVIFTNLDGH